MNELQIQINQKPGVISTNFEEIKAELSTQMQVYKELEVTEANKPERKKDVATLRKMAKAVNEKKSEVKNKFLEPYNVFEGQVKELIEIINEPITIIDNQVKDFEEKQRLQKQDDIKEAFEVIIKDYPSLVDEIGLITIYDNRWENITTSMKSVREEITSKLDKIKADVDLIKSMVSDKAEEALKLFWGDLDLAKAVTMINKYEAQKKEIEARMIEQKRLEQEKELEREKQRVRDEELERIRREREIREEEQRKAEEKEEAIREEERLAIEQKLMGIKEATEVKASATSDMVTYKIIGTPEELDQVEMYMNSIGVEFIKGEF